MSQSSAACYASGMAGLGFRLRSFPHRSTSFTVLFCLVLRFALAGFAAHPFEEDIAKFEQQDRDNPPKPGQILFLGSSSIRLWDLERSFPKLGTLNRGFGGSEISDSIYFFDRIVMPHRPTTIVFYAGDNDLANGKNAEQVAADFRAFARRVQGSLPSTRIIYISIKPSPKRWNLQPEATSANKMIRTFAAGNPLIQYLDVHRLMIGKDGKPRRELFAEDNLHLNETGYSVWAQALAPMLK